MAGEEITVIAKLDTTDIVNGVQRTEKAARDMKQVWEETTAVGFPVDQVSRDLDQTVSIAKTAGEKAGKGFFDGFVGKLLLRDAIYGLISGISQAISTAADDLRAATGDKTAGEGFAKGIGHDLSFLVRSLFPSINQSDIAQTGAEISREDSLRNIERVIGNARDDPSLLQSTSAYQSQLTNIRGQREEHQSEYDRQRQVLAASGQDNPNALAGLRANFQPQDQFLSQMEQHLRELVSLGKERDKKEESSGLAAGKEAAKSAESVRSAAEFIEGQIRKQEAEEAKKSEEDKKREAAKAQRDAAEQARIIKNRQEHANAQLISGDEEESRAAGKDLDFDRRELDHQRPTSAVRINGGLFGRNDSAATLVQHAATQISLLRSIDNELKETRKNQSDLTLL